MNPSSVSTGQIWVQTSKASPERPRPTVIIAEITQVALGAEGRDASIRTTFITPDDDRSVFGRPTFSGCYLDHKPSSESQLIELLGTCIFPKQP